MYAIAIIFICYFAFGVYTFWLNRNAISLFAKAFPHEHSKYFANKSFNEKRLTGFAFLWDRDINDIVRATDYIERARKRARICAVVFILLLFSLPMMFVVTGYVLSIISK
jgi:hypothetical protein